MRGSFYENLNMKLIIKLHWECLDLPGIKLKPSINNYRALMCLSKDYKDYDNSDNSGN